VNGRSATAMAIADALDAEREAIEEKMKALLVKETESAVAEAVASERAAAAASVESALEEERKLTKQALDIVKKQADEARALANTERERATTAQAVVSAITADRAATAEAMAEALKAEKRESAEAMRLAVEAAEKAARASLLAAQEQAKAEMERLAQEVASVRSSRDMSEDLSAMQDLKKKIETQQQQIDLLASHAKSPQPPPPPSPPTSANRNSESVREFESPVTSTTNHSENAATISGIWQSIVSYCHNKNHTLAKVWGSDFDRSQTGRNTQAQFARGLERCGCRIKTSDCELVYDDMIKRRRKRDTSMTGSTVGLDDFVTGAEFWVRNLDDTERSMLGLPPNPKASLLDHLDEECTFKPKVTNYKPPPTRKPRHSLSPNTTTPTNNRSKSPKSRKSEGGGGGMQRRKTFKEPEKVFDLSEELSNIIGQEKLKDQLLAFERGIELQARRKELGIECSEQQPPHMMFCGSKLRVSLLYFVCFPSVFLLFFSSFVLASLCGVRWRCFMMLCLIKYITQILELVKQLLRDLWEWCLRNWVC
jgi:chemotaxis protein histidine kinase CheA